MKRLIFISNLFFLFTIGLSAQATDLQLIEKTLNYYLDGGTNNDFSMLEKAFHPDATMKFVGDAYKAVNAVDFFRNAMESGSGSKQKRKTRIVTVNVTGNAANAQLEMEYANFMLIDYMNMLKIDNEWKIVSKIFTKKEAYDGK